MVTGDDVQATWRAGEPLLHSTLEPGVIRTLQQGQMEANLAVMVMCLVSFVLAGLPLPDVYTLAMDGGGVKRISMETSARETRTTRGFDAERH